MDIPLPRRDLWMDVSVDFFYPTLPINLSIIVLHAAQLCVYRMDTNHTFSVFDKENSKESIESILI